MRCFERERGHVRVEGRVFLMRLRDTEIVFPISGMYLRFLITYRQVRKDQWTAAEDAVLVEAQRRLDNR